MTNSNLTPMTIDELKDKFYMLMHFCKTVDVITSNNGVTLQKTPLTFKKWNSNKFAYKTITRSMVTENNTIQIIDMDDCDKVLFEMTTLNVVDLSHTDEKSGNDVHLFEVNGVRMEFKIP